MLEVVALITTILIANNFLIKKQLFAKLIKKFN